MLHSLTQPLTHKARGASGIRTHEEGFCPLTRFPVVLLRPTRTSLQYTNPNALVYQRTNSPVKFQLVRVVRFLDSPCCRESRIPAVHDATDEVVGGER